MATYSATFAGLLQAMGDLRDNVNAAFGRRDQDITEAWALAQEVKDGLSGKLGVPSVGSTGPQVFNATSGSWEAAPTGGGVTTAYPSVL